MATMVAGEDGDDDDTKDEACGRGRGPAAVGCGRGWRDGGGREEAAGKAAAAERRRRWRRKRDNGEAEGRVEARALLALPSRRAHVSGHAYRLVVN